MSIQVIVADNHALFRDNLMKVIETNTKDILKLHELLGKEKGTWSVWVSGNWRVTFQFDGADASKVDYRDYH